MFRFFEDFDEVEIAWYTAAVFRRTGTLSGNTSWILYSIFFNEDAFQKNSVAPSVTKIVFIYCGLTWLSEIYSDRDFPSWQNRVTFYFITRNSNFNLSPLGQLGEIKHMKMVVKPSHGILQRHVQIPKIIYGRYLDSSPNGRCDPIKSDLKLID